MTTLEDELMGMLQAGSPATSPPAQLPPATSLEDELMGMFKPPVVVEGPGGLPIATTAPQTLGGTPQPAAGPTPGAQIVDWVTQNPQVAVEMLAQTLGTSGGIALGSLAGPAAPIAMPALGAAGNVLAKMGVRALTGDPQPGGGEVAIDAAAGTAGPIGSAITKGAARTISGLNRTVRREAAEAGGAVQGSLRDFDSIADMVAASGAAHDKVITTASRAGTTARYGGQIGSLIHAMTTGDLVTSAGILAGGQAVSAAQRRAAAFLVENDRIRNWMIREMPGHIRQSETVRNQIAGSLTALAGEAWLTSEERSAVGQLIGGTGRRSDLNPRQLQAKAMTRDEHGRFDGIDHSELERLFGESRTLRRRMQGARGEIESELEQ